MGDLRTNIHSLSKRKLEVVHILLIHVWVAVGYRYGDSNIIVIEPNIMWTQNQMGSWRTGEWAHRPLTFLSRWWFESDSQGKATCVSKMISYMQTQVIWGKQKKYKPWVYFNGRAFESSVSHCSLSLFRVTLHDGTIFTVTNKELFLKELPVYYSCESD